MLSFVKSFFYLHKPLPLGRWLSVTTNHDILEIKYSLKKERQLQNNIDPYEMNRMKDSKEKLVSNFVFIDW